MSKKSKKEAVTGANKKSGGKTALILSVVLIAAVAVGYILFAGSSASATAVTAENGMVYIPLKDVSTSKAKYFTYQSGGTTVKFFVLKSSDGVVRAALDACDVCFQEKKGYRQEGDFMVCNNCGQRFPSVKVNDVTGGCNPVALARTIEGDRLVISAANLERGVSYF